MSPRLDVVRWLCLTLTGSLLCVSLIGVVADWILVLSCLRMSRSPWKFAVEVR